MAAPCTEHLFLTGEKGVGKSTLARHLLAGHTPCGFRTVRVDRGDGQAVGASAARCGR